MKLTKTTPPPTRDEWAEVLEKLAREPGQWMIVSDHGMAEKSVRPWAYKVSNGKYATANKVAAAHNGRFEAVTHEGQLNIRFVNN